MSIPSTAVSRNNKLSNNTVDSPTELIGAIEYSGVCMRTPEDVRYRCIPTPPDTDTTDLPTVQGLCPFWLSVQAYRDFLVETNPLIVS